MQIHRVRHCLGIVVALSLGGCEIVAPTKTIEAFRPYVMDMKNGPQYEADRGKCAEVAKAYPHSFSVGDVATAGAQGGAKNLAAAAINPLVPALGAAGGATDELLAGLGLTVQNQIRVFARCMYEKGKANGSYVVVDPNL